MVDLQETDARVGFSGRYESYSGLSPAEACGILHGCENGRCIRVAEGYTCDCYQGYELDMTSMTCTGAVSGGGSRLGPDAGA